MKFVYPLKNKTPDALFEMNRMGGGGYYPLGSNNAYHGGIHLWPGNEPIVAIADGEIIAYRYMSDYKPPEAERDTPKYSNCFILIRHKYVSPKGQKLTFYSLYMHLRPWSACNETQKEGVTAFGKPGFEIVNAPNGLKLRSSNVIGDNKVGLLANGTKHVATSLDGTWAKITEGEHANKYFCHTYRGTQYGKPIKVPAEPELDHLVTGSINVKAGDVIGYAGLYEDEVIGRGRRTVHIEVFAGSDAETFLSNPENEGKRTNIVVEPQTTKKRSGQDPYTAGVEWFQRYAKTVVERIDSTDTGEWVQVKEKLVVGNVKKAWLHDKYPNRTEYKTPPPSISDPPTLKHYTARTDHVEDLKAAFPGYDISGEDAGEDGVNYFKETDATKFTYAGRSPDNTPEEPWRLVFLDVGDAGKVYWIQKSRLKQGKELGANADKCSETAPSFQLEDGEEVPQEYATELDRTGRMIHEGKLWYGVELPSGIKGWVPEDKARLESPYDWPGFSLIKEEDDSRTPLLFEPGNMEADYEALPEFFKKLVDTIDADHDKTLTSIEIKTAFETRPDVSDRLSRLICVHPSEWWGGGEDRAPWKPIFDKLGEARAEKFKERLGELCWWKEVKDKLGDSFPDSPIVYHWHPITFVSHMNELSGSLISMAMIKTAGARGTQGYLNELLGHINRFASAYGIDTPLRIAHFLAQAGHESSLKVVEEKLSYRAERMQEVFTTTNSDGTRKYQKLWDSPETYARNPEALASYVYADRMGNGNEASKEGYKYRGRGLIQLTGKNNYTAFTRHHNERFPDDQKDFVADPDLLTRHMQYGVESAFSWWLTNNVNDLCTGTGLGDVKKVTKRVNGGYKGLEDRKSKFDALRNLLGV